MNESKRTGQRMETSKETYVKPAIEVIEMELDTAILTGIDSTYPDGGLSRQSGSIVNDSFGNDPSNFSKNV